MKIGKPVREPKPGDPGWEHPDDMAMRLDSEAWAKRVGSAWAERHRIELEALVLTYADADAGELLARLRDQFWSTDQDKEPL